MEEKERERVANLSTEEKLAEKLRLQKIQEEADLRVAMDTFGVGGDKTGIDALHPTNGAGLSELADAINQKVTQFKDLEDFPGFLEELTRNICSTCKFELLFSIESGIYRNNLYGKMFVSVAASDLQKIKKTIDTLYTEKQKMEKEKTKKNAKGKTKASLRMEADNVSVFQILFLRSFQMEIVMIDRFYSLFFFSSSQTGKY